MSVAICCYNAGNTIEAACRSVRWADEIVVVDSGSTDATPELARRHADRFVVEPWRGYTEQKKYATSLCRNDWVLVLDADEECSPELAGEILGLGADDLERVDVLHMRRRNYLMGRYVRAWGPDWQSRLIHRGRCHWRDEVLHDARLPSHPDRVRRLRGWLEHRRLDRGDLGDYFDAAIAEERFRLVAADLFASGRRARWLDLWFRPPFAFFKFYILRLGFLDGKFGLLVAQRAATATQLKYAALWVLEDRQRRPVPTDPTRRTVRDPGSR